MNQTFNEQKNPAWWTDECEDSWERVKLAMKRDWDQTKHDFGGHQPDTHQNARHTTRQASGREIIPPRGQPAYEELEPAYRFGYAARFEYGDLYPDWGDELETQLKHDWERMAPARKKTWMQDLAAIRFGWDYDRGFK